MAYVPSTSYALDDVPKSHKEMCKCAQQHNLCDGNCRDLFNVDNLSDECGNYVAQGVCADSFPSDKTYGEYCPKIGVPCTDRQKNMFICRCARKHDLCDKTCPDLFSVDDVSEECSDYALGQMSCGGSFPTDKTYEEFCPSVNVPCTNSQRMCKCANQFKSCGKKCFDLADHEKCGGYAIKGLCGGTFPSDETYEDHCETVGMKCNRKCDDSSSWQFVNALGGVKKCNWIAIKPGKRCNRVGTGGVKAKNACLNACKNCPDELNAV